MRITRVQNLSFIVVLAAIKIEVSAKKNLVVASYNLWNVMFQWDVRKYIIAEMILQADPDIIGFQEVRVGENGEQSQLQDLQQLLPEYKYSAFHSTSTIKDRFGTKSISGWEQEGLGILSKHAILMSHQIPLSKANKKDQSPRALLHTQIEYDMHEIFFIVVHFSTDRKLQCQNALRVINFVASTGTDRTLIVGDFNTYNDFDWPIEAVKSGFFLPNGCRTPKNFEPMGKDQGYGFGDSWQTTNKGQDGFTFSNMLSPGFINRPDRILVSTVGLDPVKTTLYGEGNKYFEKYNTRSYMSRMQTMIRMAKERWSGNEILYSCHLDCGPHGSCRCGVCVGGGNKQNCNLSSCSECTAKHYNIVLFLYYTISIYVVSLIYASVGLWAKCVNRRRLKKIFVCSKWFGFKHLIAFTFAGVLIFYTIVKIAFSDMFASALNRLPEETYPSDHLMVVSEIKMSYH